MAKRSLFPALALGVLAFLIPSAPSYAVSTFVTVNSLLMPIPSGVTSISELDVTFSALAAPFPDLNLTTPPTSKGSSISISGDTVKIAIAASASDAFLLLGQGISNFDFLVPFDVATAVADVKISSTTWVTNVGNRTGSTTLSFLEIPEPASISLLAVGAVGAVAFRRRLNPVRRRSQ
jgi:hypothetical protein